MANLRVNEITTGIGSYHGSIYASGTGAYLLSTVTAPGTDDFTIECYINSDNASGTNQEGVFAINAQSGGFQSGSSNQLRLVQGRDGTDGQNGGLEVSINGTQIGTGDGNDIIQEGTWHHVAVTRASGTVKIWVDGVEKASGSAAGDVTGTTFITAYYDSGYTYQGFMSNFRYRKGTAHYTTTFTAPTKPLERTTDTELIFAQSPHNAANGFSSAIHGGITDIMQVNGNVTANASSPTQLSDTSGVGVVFNGPIKQNTQGYMYFPTGNTRERNRGRGIIFGGYSPGLSPNYQKTIYQLDIQSMGDAIRFGDLSVANYSGSTTCASSTRAVRGGGRDPSGRIDTIEFVEIATTGNAVDFGNLVAANSFTGGGGNQTRGIWMGGSDYPNTFNVIQFITIATTGDATDFGDLNNQIYQPSIGASPTRILAMGGGDPSSFTAQIDFVEIATTGNATDFGDLTLARNQGAGVSSNTRAVAMGGAKSPGLSDIIDFVTIATTGDATDFGDLSSGAEHTGAVNNSVRGVQTGGRYPSYVNNLQFITIATTGNGQDFGDIKVTSLGYTTGASDSHGGLS